MGYRLSGPDRGKRVRLISDTEFMHELSIMQSALSQALEQARHAGAGKVHEIRLRIGVLSGVVPEALQFAFEVLAEGTPPEARD